MTSQNRSERVEAQCPGYLRKQAAAQYMGICERTLSDLMRKRVIPFHKVSRGLVLFRISDIDQALDKFRVESIKKDVR